MKTNVLVVCCRRRKEWESWWCRMGRRRAMTQWLSHSCLPPKRTSPPSVSGLRNSWLRRRRGKVSSSLWIITDYRDLVLINNKYIRKVWCFWRFYNKHILLWFKYLTILLCTFYYTDDTYSVISGKSVELSFIFNLACIKHFPDSYYLPVNSEKSYSTWQKRKTTTLQQLNLTINY